MGTIYFAVALPAKDGHPQYVKIGYTEGSVDTRIRNLQTGCPLLIDVYRVEENKTLADEAALHRRFADVHVMGEWFDGDPRGPVFCYIAEEEGWHQ
jgi:Meiotically Up-regulated Gene 113 (MUG113) protein